MGTESQWGLTTEKSNGGHMVVAELQSLRAVARAHAHRPDVAQLLRRSEEAPRVGACTIHTPVLVDLPDTRRVHLRWPAIGVDVDVIFLVHDGPLTAKMRDRIAAGPAEFIIVAHPQDIPQAWEAVNPAQLAAARVRSLRAGLVAKGIIPRRMGKGRLGMSLSVGVVGPDAVARERVTGLLQAAGVAVQRGPMVDVVVAVAPPQGWQPSDGANLEQAFAQVGRMVATAPLPAGVCPDALVVPESEVVAAVVKRLSTPPLAPLPTPNPALWERCAVRLERPITGAIHRRDLAMGLADSLVITMTAYLGLVRILGVELGMCVAIGLGALRMWVRLGGALPGKWRGGPRRGKGPSEWVRRKLAANFRG